MEMALLIVSILLIAIVLLQSNKASDASQIISGGNDALFQNQKERGVELLITRVTVLLGALFFIISFIMFIK
ncbi:MAG: preprotein translocase subunit SecG [Bacilli bacterium]|nr:preprotein translocase subunit SecG [Bacilli bacterium]